MEGFINRQPVETLAMWFSAAIAVIAIIVGLAVVGFFCLVGVAIKHGLL